MKKTNWPPPIGTRFRLTLDVEVLDQIGLPARMRGHECEVTGHPVSRFGSIQFTDLAADDANWRYGWRADQAQCLLRSDEDE
jgi:hypothetical protein